MNFSKRFPIVVIASLLAGWTLTATASSKDNDQLPANYLGASIGSSDSAAACNNLSDCDESSSTWKVYSGVRLTGSVMLEGGYINFAETAGKDSAGERASSELSGYTSAAVARFPVSNKITAFGKAGVFFWDSESERSTGQSSYDGKDLFFGAGASYTIGDDLALRAEWERFEGIKQHSDSEELVDLLSLGVGFSSL